MLVLGDLGLHVSVDIPEQLLRVVNRVSLEAVREVLDNHFFCPIKETLLVIILTSKLREREAGVLAKRRVQKNLSCVILRLLNIGRVEVVLVSLNEVLFVGGGLEI
jgi:hypothetical protein